MILNNLRNIYNNLHLHNETYYLFNFVKNKVCFEVLFDIFPSPFQLHFLQRENNFSFHIDVEVNFKINLFLDSQTYRGLCEVLGLSFDKDNPFSTKSFFEEFNLNIPNYQFRKKEERELLIFYQNDIEEADKLYFDGVIEWNKIKNGKKVTYKNLEKTRILYPKLYDWCKRENVSIRYTHIEKNDEKYLIEETIQRTTG